MEGVTGSVFIEFAVDMITIVRVALMAADPSTTIRLRATGVGPRPQSQVMKVCTKGEA